jgi:hypothetical protein
VTAPAGAPPGARIVLPVKLRRVQRLELVRSALEHGPAALTLLGAGLAGVRRSGGDRLLGVVEVAACAWLLVMLLREARHVLAGDDPHAPLLPMADDALPRELEGVDWTGVASSTLIAVEVWHRWAATGHVVRPFVLSAAFTLAMAVGGRRLIARRVRPRLGRRTPHLALSAEGIEYRGSRRRRFDAAWADVAAADCTADAIHLRLRDGRDFTLRARDHVQGAALVAAVRDALPRFAPALAAGAPPS